MSPTALEMLIHLAAATQGQTTRDLIAHCPSAADRTAVSRAAYDLRKEGLICEVGTVQSHTGRGARPITAYSITQLGRAYLSPEPDAASLPGALDEDREALRAEWHNADLNQTLTMGLDTTTAEALQDRIAAADARTHAEPTHPTCPTCGGDDHAAPCAYPGEDKPGCLRSPPAPGRDALISAAAAIVTTADPAPVPAIVGTCWQRVTPCADEDQVLAELRALDRGALLASLPAAAEHALRLRVLADSMARLVGHGDQTVATYLWLRQLADLFDPEAP